MDERERFWNYYRKLSNFQAYFQELDELSKLN